MCLIIDANVISLVFEPNPENEFEPIRTALFKKKAVAVHGGKLTREYLKIKRLGRILTELDRIGSLRVVADAAVDSETEVVCREGHCVSDDQHLIALARVSRVRLLCSHDRDLHADFTNPSVLHPLGSVYQRRSHRHLIRQHCGKSIRRD